MGTICLNCCGRQCAPVGVFEAVFFQLLHCHSVYVLIRSVGEVTLIGGVINFVGTGKLLLPCSVCGWFNESMNPIVGRTVATTDWYESGFRVFRIAKYSYEMSFEPRNGILKEVLLEWIE